MEPVLPTTRLLAYRLFLEFGEFDPRKARANLIPTPLIAVSALAVILVSNNVVGAFHCLFQAGLVPVLAFESADPICELGSSATGNRHNCLQ